MQEITIKDIEQARAALDALGATEQQEAAVLENLPNMMHNAEREGGLWRSSGKRPGRLPFPSASRNG